MDFLLMAILYTLFFVGLSYIIFAGKSEYHRSGLVGLLRRNLFSVRDWQTVNISGYFYRVVDAFVIKTLYAQYLSCAYFRSLSLISKKISHKNNLRLKLTFEKYAVSHQVAHFVKSAFERCIPAAVTRLISNITTYLLFTRYLYFWVK